MTSPSERRPSSIVLDSYAATSDDAAAAVRDLRRLCALLPVHARHRSNDDGLVPVDALWRRVADIAAVITQRDVRPDTFVNLGLLKPKERPRLGRSVAGDIRLAHHRLNGGLSARRSLSRNPARLLEVAVHQFDECSELVVDNSDHRPYSEEAMFDKSLDAEQHQWVTSLPTVCDELLEKPRLFPLWREYELSPRQELDVIETLIVRTRASVLSAAVEATERMVGQFILKEAGLLQPEGDRYLIDASGLSDVKQHWSVHDVLTHLGHSVIDAVGRERGRGAVSDLNRLRLAEEAAAEVGFDIGAAFSSQREALIEDVARTFASDLQRRASTVSAQDLLRPGSELHNDRSRSEGHGRSGGFEL